MVVLHDHQKCKEYIMNMDIKEVIERPRMWEEYSDILETHEGRPYRYAHKVFKDSNNSNPIVESTLARLLNRLDSDDFAIITAHRAANTKRENILRNRALRYELNKRKMGVYQLIGHWLEAPDGYDGVPYNEIPKNVLKDTVERSYLVERPSDMEFKDFIGLMQSLMTIEGQTQDAIVVGHEGSVFLLYKDGNMEKIATSYNMGKIAQAYSEWVGKKNAKFVFEGMEVPGSNAMRKIFHDTHIKWIEP